MCSNEKGRSGRDGKLAEAKMRLLVFISVGGHRPNPILNPCLPRCGRAGMRGDSIDLFGQETEFGDMQVGS